MLCLPQPKSDSFFGQDTMKLSLQSLEQKNSRKSLFHAWSQGRGSTDRLPQRAMHSHVCQPGAWDVGMNLAPWACCVPPPARRPWHLWHSHTRSSHSVPELVLGALLVQPWVSGREGKSAWFDGKVENRERKVTQKVTPLHPTLMGGCRLWQLLMLLGLVIF